MAKITLREIALKAGVAKSTASYALNDSYTKGVNIPEETRTHIKKIASEMGYVIDDMARAIATGKTKVLGLTCGYGRIGDSFAPVLGNVMSAASRYDFFIKMLHQEPGRDDDFIASCVRQRLSAVLFYIPDESRIQYMVDKLAENSIIPAIIGNSVTPENCIHVRCDDREGSRMMVNKLYELGHRKIAYMSTNLEYLASRIRRDGYLDAVKELSLKVPEEYVWGSGHVGKIKEHVFHLLKNRNLCPDAFYCSGDNIAEAVIGSVNEFGLKVPLDISVAGFGDLVCGRCSVPQISTIDECHVETSTRVVEKIIGELSGRKHGEYSVKIKPLLIMRESTASKNP